jgi:hypothetical protein
MSNQTRDKLVAGNVLDTAITGAVLEASKSGMSTDDIKAVLQRALDLLEADEEE